MDNKVFPPVSRCQSGSPFPDEVLQAALWCDKSRGCCEEQESRGSGAAAVPSLGLDRAGR